MPISYRESVDSISAACSGHLPERPRGCHTLRSQFAPGEMMKMKATLGILLVLAGACVQPAPPRGQEGEWAAIVALEAEAKAIAKTTGCANDAQCRSAPVGARACGGPRYYLPYCAATTDSAALFRKLDEVAAAERAFNTKYQIGSTCEFRMPPTVGIVNSACAAR